MIKKIITATAVCIMVCILPAFAENQSDARYPLTEAERRMIECNVWHESGNQTLAGQMMVAECILNACERSDVRPAEAMRLYGYAEPANYELVTESVKDAVHLVFDKGYTVTNDMPIWFYNPRLCRSDWHESMRFVCELGDHRFFGV